MTNKKNTYRVIKYGFFGLVAAGLEFLLFIAIVDEVNVYVASTVSFCLGLAASFIFNKYIVFKKSSKIKKLELIQFVSLGVINSQLSSIITVGLSLVIPSAVAKIITMGIIAIWNYLIMGHFIFKSRS